MKKFTLFVGIDISRNWFDASLTTDGLKKHMIHCQFENNTKGFKKFMVWVKKHAAQFGLKGPWLFCMEHTGVYTLPLCVFLEEQQLDFVTESALRIKRSLGIRRGKSDKADSKDIAKYAITNSKDLKISTLPSVKLMELKNFLTYRARLVKQRMMLKASSKEFNAFMPKKFSSDFIQNDSKELIKILNAKIKAVQKAILEVINEEPELKRLYELVISVKGIGFVTTVTMLVFTNCFKAFENARKFACYIAIAPFDESSGTSFYIAPKVGKMGHTKIKALLSNACCSAIQYDEQIKAYYNRKIKEGKEKGCVQNNVKNKLISRIFAVVKRGTPFVELKY